MGDVPECDFGLAVRDMLELVFIRDVADRPHAVDRRTHVLIDHDRAVVMTREATRLGVEEITVRLPARRDEQLVDLDHLAHAMDGDRVAATLDLDSEFANELLAEADVG